MMKVTYHLSFSSIVRLFSNQSVDTSNEDIPPPPPQMSDETKSSLIIMANWLLENGRDEYLTVYGKVRGGVLQRSLTLLRNHQRSVSGGSTHGVASSPMLVSYY